MYIVLLKLIKRLDFFEHNANIIQSKLYLIP